MWCEAVEGRKIQGLRRDSRSPEEEWASKVRETERLVSLGRISQALYRLTSLGLASDTPEVKAALLAKFPAVPLGREDAGRHPVAP